MAPDLFEQRCAALGLPDDEHEEVPVVSGPDLAVVAREAGPLFAQYLALSGGRLNRRALRGFLSGGP